MLHPFGHNMLWTTAMEDEGTGPGISRQLHLLTADAEKCRLDDCQHPTLSSKEQARTEKLVLKTSEAFRPGLKQTVSKLPLVDRENITECLLASLRKIPFPVPLYQTMRPFLVYWSVNSLCMLDHELSEGQALSVARYLARCQDPQGGFAGYPGSVASISNTFAAVASLCMLATVSDKVLKLLDRANLYRYLFSLRHDDGSFSTQLDETADLRAVYCAVAVARLTNMCTKQLFAGTVEWIKKCQTYEGGFGGQPGSEAHGGYTYCAISALAILNQSHTCDLKRLLRWTVNRQMAYEAGYNGRPNKLVCSCYNYWVGATLPLIQTALRLNGDSEISAENVLMDRLSTQEFLLVSCQKKRGFIPRPGYANETPEEYHTCLSLMGMSVAQHCGTGVEGPTNGLLLGSPENCLSEVHPAFSIPKDAVLQAASYFQNDEPPTA